MKKCNKPECNRTVYDYIPYCCGLCQENDTFHSLACDARQEREKEKSGKERM